MKDWVCLFFVFYKTAAKFFLLGGKMGLDK